jgi:iron-sulfur cluster assembly protein
MSTEANQTHIVDLTESAVKQVSRLLTKEPDKNPESYGFRLAIKGGGCSGLSYDLRFDQRQEKDLIQDFQNIKVFVDPKSAIYLKGMIVDFDDGLMGKGFVFKNPNATNTCGCGESFSVF